MLPAVPMKALANQARPRMRYSMPRKKKISDNDNMPDGAVAGNGSTAQTAKSTVKKKAAPPPKPKKTTPQKPASQAISDEAIRVRAYLIAQERVRRGLPGDENSDWLEARRQLMAELG
jgi:Protein of unknown function (DUF2934)